MTENYRTEIDNIDAEISALLQKRFNLCAKIGREKAAEGLAVRDEKREAEILENLPGSRIRSIYSSVLSASRFIQTTDGESDYPTFENPLKIGILNPFTMNTAISVRSRYAKTAIILFKEESDLTAAVKNGSVDGGVIPLRDCLQTVINSHLYIKDSFKSPENEKGYLLLGAAPSIPSGRAKTAFYLETSADFLSEIFSAVHSSGSRITRLCSTFATPAEKQGYFIETDFVNPEKLRAFCADFCDGFRLLGIYPAV